MLNLNHLTIPAKLRIMSIVTLTSVLVLGFMSNYLFQTSKLLGIIINAERIHNNTFQEGVEDFFKYLSTSDKLLLDSGIVKIGSANQMAYHFAIIDQLLQLPKERCTDILFNSYKEAFNSNKDNAYLMRSRISLLLTIKRDKISEAQKVTMEGYLLGEKIKKEIEEFKKSNGDMNFDFLGSDLHKIRLFYQDFARIITALDDFANDLLFWAMLIILTSLILLLWIISLLISRSISLPLEAMVKNFQVISRGNLNTKIPINSKNEIGKLASSFREIQDGLLIVIEYTRNVADGDYSREISPRSEEDELSFALNKMVSKLKSSYEQAEKDSWFKSGINRINEKLSGDHTPVNLSTNTLEFLMDFLHSQLGSIHIYNPEYQFLKLVASSGFDPKKLKERIKLNEGILGQVASKKTLTILSDLPSESYVSFSSSGNYIPKQVVIIPLVFNDLLIGVLELSSLNSYSDLEIDFLKEAADIIAINISSAINMVKTNELLQKTQEQAGELQVQQEELRVANEELTEHTRILTDNEKRLQVQQEELRVSNEELEERTRQLEIQKEEIENKNRELTEIKDALEIKARELQLSSQYKSEFLANMSHELRTPLNSLLILSKLLSNNKKGNLSTDQVESAKIIYKSGNDLLYLINEVLDLSKIEAGKITLEFGIVSIQEIREELISDFKIVAEDKHLTFEVSVINDFPRQIETDRYRLMQILKNLLSNAFKFTKEGHVKVDFIIPAQNVKFNNPSLAAGNVCCITIEDSGVGIPAEKLEAIFEAFQQADGSISRRYGGTGLGLSISRELIRMLGGEIQLQSKVNEGSVFSVFLPVINPQIIAETVINAQSLSSKELVEKLPETNNAENDAIIKLPWFVSDDRYEAGNDNVILIIHPSKQQAERYTQQVRAKNYRVIVSDTISDGVLLAEKFHPLAIMLAVELTNDPRSYHLLKSNPLIRKLPVHIITPIEYAGSLDEDELRTIDNIEISNALETLKNNFLALSRKILVIEDDTITQKIISDLLSQLDIKIEVASFAEEAFNMLSNESFDCMILDLGLPDYSGKELLEKLRANYIPLPKVIVYTGKEISKEEHKKLSAYTDTIILKGLKSDERLMDEVTLFLHQVSRTIPDHKIKVPSLEGDNLFKGKKILVVDDEIRNVFALGKILEEWDIEVLEAENGKIAIDMLKSVPGIDLVLMDVMMPVLDGYEAMRIIRKSDEIKNIPIICLTAKAMKEDYENAIQNGANDYLSKPVNEDKLFAMLKIWLYKK